MLSPQFCSVEVVTCARTHLGYVAEMSIEFLRKKFFIFPTKKELKFVAHGEIVLTFKDRQRVFLEHESIRNLSVAMGNKNIDPSLSFVVSEIICDAIEKHVQL